MSAALELQGVSKAFGAVQALRNVTFSAEAGHCLGLIGPNGAGKTTAFSLLAGYLSPSRGQVRVLGRNPRVGGALKGVLAILPQDAQLPNHASVGRVLTYFAQLSGVANPLSAARDVLARVGMEASFDTLPRTLSHGMSKRVALAQALLGDPQVLLLDEPTAGLDPVRAAEVREIIRAAKGARTVVVSSHNLQELESLCDDIALLERGQLVNASTVAQLTSQHEEFHVQVARGNVPLPLVSAVPGVAEVLLSPSGLLTVRCTAGRPPEDVTTDVLRVLITANVAVLSVARGKALEASVLALSSRSA